MGRRSFLSAVRIIHGLKYGDLVANGVIADDDPGAWEDFKRDPYRWMMRATEARSTALWALVDSKASPWPDGGVEDPIDALNELCAEFGLHAGEMRLPWLRDRLKLAERTDVLCAPRSGIYVASKIRHAPTWRAMRAEGIPIISTWIDEAGPGESKDLANLWDRCVNEAASARVLLLYRLPEETLKGAFVELGAALKAGVPVCAVGIEEFTVSHAAGITHYPNLDAALEAARLIAA